MTTSNKQLGPTAAGAGLVALDVVQNEIDGDEPKYLAGGTCGNVMAVLSFLGWNALPIARLRNDTPAEWIIDDLSRCGVSTDYVTETGDGSTPIIVERIRETATGDRYHSYTLRCPCCGSYLPGYKSIRGKDAELLGAELPPHQVFFFDRVSRGTLTLAEVAADRGALVVFEPSGIGEPRLFREAWSVAHVVKYSNDRLRDIADLDLDSTVRNSLLLEIETLGAGGLRYRSRLNASRNSRWKALSSLPTPRFRDAAGSGDWCTAGLINRLARGGLRGFRKASDERLVNALKYGQALAAWNCSYDSARGGMYEVSRTQFDRQIRSLMQGRSIRVGTDGVDVKSESLSKLCPTCEQFKPKQAASA